MFGFNIEKDRDDLARKGFQIGRLPGGDDTLVGHDFRILSFAPALITSVLIDYSWLRITAAFPSKHLSQRRRSSLALISAKSTSAGHGGRHTQGPPVPALAWRFNRVCSAYR